MTALLQVRDLSVRYGGGVEALNGVSFAVDRGESLAVVGESGAGKSTLTLALAGLLPTGDVRGSIQLAGTEVVGATDEVLRELRWQRIAVSLQAAPFNPLVRLGDQIAEPLTERRGLRPAAARRKVTALAEEILLEPELLDRFPHEVSGGQRRRAAVAMALTLDPDVVVLDEPTAGLDPVMREGLVVRLRTLAERRGLALVTITHSLADAAQLAGRTSVLYAGEVMEHGETDRVLRRPAHPYTWALVGAYPSMDTTRDLRPIRGVPPDPGDRPTGCPFHPRCTQAEPICRERPVELTPSRGRLVACHPGGRKVLLGVRGVRRSFGRGARTTLVLDGVDLEVHEGETLAIVGPSGSGKSTLARIISGQLAADAGEVTLRGELLGPPRGRADRLRRARAVQLVLQDPWDALSPRLTIGEIVREPLDLRRAPTDAEAEVVAALMSVGVTPTTQLLGARVHQLSGGQLQRIALARALVAGPRLLVADEPTSLLDASEQARLMAALRERQTERGIGLVLVSHDLALVRKAADRLAILDGGRLVETGPTEDVCAAPRTAIGRKLIAAAPSLRPSRP